MTEPTTETTEPNDLAKRRRVHQLTAEMADLLKAGAERYVELHDIGVDTRDIVKLIGAELPTAANELVAQNESLAFSMDAAYLSLTMPTPKTDDERREQSKRMAALMGKYYDSGMDTAPAFFSQATELIERKSRDPQLGWTPMRRLIERLFAEAPKLNDASGSPVEGQAPALECSIVLRTLPMQLTGSLSRTPEGILRLLSPTEIQDPQTKRQKMVLAEQFFELEDVVTIVLQRDISMSANERRIIS